MSDQYLGEIRAFGINFAPQGWAACNGQLLPISQNTALFSLLGAQYGGDGKSTFGLPNLQGNVAMGSGQGAGLTPRNPGDAGGTETVTLTEAQTPAHNHAANCNAGNGNQPAPLNGFWAQDLGGANEYGDTGPAQMATGALQPVGGIQAHNNVQPYLAVLYCIALVGIYPPRS